MRQLTRALVAVALIAAPAGAAEKPLFIGSFERLRVEGPYQVTVTTGRSPGGRLSGDASQFERVEARLDGTTLVVRPAIERWQERAAASAAAPVALSFATPMLSSVTVIGGGAVTVAGGRSPRLDLSVTGAGSIALTGVQTEQVQATVIGGGSIALGGRADRVRLLTNGAGRIDADALQADEVTVRVDGPGDTRARARYAATVTNLGLGHVTIAGTPHCVIKSDAGGPVTCGAAAAPIR